MELPVNVHRTIHYVRRLEEAQAGGRHVPTYDYGSDEDESDFWNNKRMMLLQMCLNNRNVPESERDEAIEVMMAFAGDPKAV